MRKLLVGLSLLVLLTYPLQVHADVALDTIKSRVNELLDVLRDPALQSESTLELKKEKIRAILAKTIDYPEVSKRTLSRNWSKLNLDQRKEFTKLYKTLLEKIYMVQILEYKDQKFVFGKERTLAQNRVEVRSKIISGSKEIPLHYRMISKNGQWWVYDVIVEGISLVKNYRSQFRRLIKKKSIGGMMEVLREKTKT